MFFNYVNKLKEEDKNIFFDFYWDWAIQEVIKKRQLKHDSWYEQHWFTLLTHVNNQTEYFDDKRCNELLDVFHTNLKSNKKWKKKWHNDFFYLEKAAVKGREATWRAEQFLDEMYFNEPDPNERELGPMYKNTERWDHKPQLELWGPDNWWKKW
jgi:hypothetical protein